MHEAGAVPVEQRALTLLVRSNDGSVFGYPISRMNRPVHLCQFQAVVLMAVASIVTLQSPTVSAQEAGTPNTISPAVLNAAPPGSRAWTPDSGITRDEVDTLLRALRRGEQQCTSAYYERDDARHPNSGHIVGANDAAPIPTDFLAAWSGNGTVTWIALNDGMLGGFRVLIGRGAHSTRDRAWSQCMSRMLARTPAPRFVGTHTIVAMLRSTN